MKFISNYYYITIILLGYLSVSLAATPVWWDNSYTYSQDLHISTPDAVSSGHSISINADLQSLVSASKLRADYQDLNVVYWNGVTNTVLDRHIRQASLGNDVWFSLQTAKTAGSMTSGEYRLYYGNAAAMNAPENYSNVYRFYDGFEGATLSGQWQGQRGTYTVANGALTMPAHFNNQQIIHTTGLLPHDSVREYALKPFDINGIGQLYFHTLAGANTVNDFTNGNRITHDFDSPTTRVRREGFPSYNWPHSSTEFNIFQNRILGTDQTYWAGTDETNIAQQASRSGIDGIGTAFKINSQWTKQQMFIDYVLVRDHVGTAPTLSFSGSELTNVPEPSSIWLFALAMVAVGYRRRMKNKQSNI